MIPLQYRIHTGRWLHSKNPQRFTEKLQIYKLHYHNPLMLRCTDKYEVRYVISEKGMQDILIPLVGIYDSPSAIDFNALPMQFVAKTTDGGGGNQVLVCRNKKLLSQIEFNSKIKRWMAQPKSKPAGREWAYENDYPRKIIIEQLINDETHLDLIDYKFFCFSGEPYICQVISNRSSNEQIDFYDMKWNRLVGVIGLNSQAKNSPTEFDKPINYTKMKEIAQILSSDFPFVRVDLYNVKGKIYFGELTFYPASGYGTFIPDSFDYKLGRLFNINYFNKHT
ncbi:MAG: ATP-grasp fold amidoligase family protein [Bacteroidaceae bacterium]